MPKGSGELASARKEEIINACAELYETMGFKDITIRDIGARTSFTRTSIYNYFQTKEEIFLALLQREHRAWITDLEAVMQTYTSLSVDGFADMVAHTLEKRECMLKLISMNLYDMEGNSRMENLVEFKQVYGGSIQAVASCIERFFPAMADGAVRQFLYAFFPFLFGVYPYTMPTVKQREAMELAQVEYASYTIYEITRNFVARMLCAFLVGTQEPSEKD